MAKAAWNDHGKTDCRATIGGIGISLIRTTIAWVVRVTASVCGHVAPNLAQCPTDSDVVPAG